MAHDAQLSFAGGAVLVAGVAAAGLATRLRLLAHPIASTVETCARASAGSSGRGWHGPGSAGPCRDPRHIRGYRGRAARHRALNIASFAALVSAGLQGPIVHSLAARIWTGEREQVGRHALLRSPAKAELEVS